MAANGRFFIIRADGSTLTVNANQLASMRQSGFIGPDDKVIPVSGEPNSPVQPSEPPIAMRPTAPKNNSPFGKFAPAVDDIDTAPIEYRASRSHFSDLDDIEIDQAFSAATSRSLYQLEAEKAENSLLPTNERSKPLRSEKSENEYSLRLKDGRVLGPFDTKSIESKIREQTLDELTEIADFGSDVFMPLKERIEFAVVFKLFLDCKIPSQKDRIFQIREASIAPLLLELSHQLQTGWLFVQGEGDIFFLASIAIGKILNIHPKIHVDGGVEQYLKQIFALDYGQAWFEPHPSAASDRAENTESTISLCRRLTSINEGFALSRLLRIVGDQTRLLQPRPSSSWLVSKEDLSEAEIQIIENATRSLSIHATLHDLVQKQLSEASAIHALFLCQIAGLTSSLSEKASQDIQTLYTELSSGSFIDLLSISEQTPHEDVVRELMALKSRVFASTKPLSIRDPLRQKMRERVNEIYDILLDPAERYAYFTARERGEDLSANPELRDALKREFLERKISQLFEKRDYVGALPSAEKYYRLAPNDSDASTKYLLAKFFSVENRQEQIRVIGEMQDRLRTHGPSVELFLTLASANLEMRDFGEAKKYLRRAHRLAPDDARIKVLRRDYDSLSLAEAEVRGTGPIKLISVFWISLVTLSMTAILWVLAIDLEMGQHETYDKALDVFSAVRASSLILATMIGYFFLHRKGMREFFIRFKWNLSIRALVLCALFGSLVGVMLFRFSVINEELSALGFLLLVLTTFIDRFYFSGLVAYDLFNSISRRWIAVVWVSILYAIYYGSFHEVVHAASVPEVLIRITVLFFGLSFPMAFIQSVTKSVIAPMVFQIFFVIFAKIITHFGGSSLSWFGKW